MPLRSCSSRTAAACQGSVFGSSGSGSDDGRPWGWSGSSASRVRWRAGRRRRRPVRRGPDQAADAENRAVRRVDGHVVVVAVGDRAGPVDEG